MYKAPEQPNEDPCEFPHRQLFVHNAIDWPARNLEGASWLISAFPKLDTEGSGAGIYGLDPTTERGNNRDGVSSRPSLVGVLSPLCVYNNDESSLVSLFTVSITYCSYARPRCSARWRRRWALTLNERGWRFTGGTGRGSWGEGR